ncbi:hypothetical protein GCM10022234_31440 [Aeromicrobium panaciterrae]|uniref:ACT domain-containing protein n=1 Tax=Aeromicrobium panaciterrae TaxID=363861 RepID=UPI0031DE23B5
MLWRVRTTFIDRPGILAETALACGDAGVNILGMQVFATGERVTDVFVVSAPDGWDDLDIAQLFERAGGAQVSVTRVDQGATVDSATRYLHGVREVLEHGRDVADVLAELLETEPPDVADYAGHDVLELNRRNGAAVSISRAGPFTPVEKERAQAFLALTREVVSPTARVTALPGSAVPLVRQASLEDAEAVAALHQRCSDATLFDRYQVPLQLPMTARMTRRLVAPDHGMALVVQQAHDIVGHGLLEDLGDIWTFRLLIQDTHQDAGLEPLLVRQAASHAKTAGAGRLTLITAESNDTLLRAVGNAGFMARIERRDGGVHISVPLAAVRSIQTG